jgi:cysteine desulfurase family protein
MIYFDNAATSLHRPPDVARAVVEAMSGLGSTGRGAHDFALQAGSAVYDARVLLSDMFNVGDPHRVVFTANATASLNLVIQGCLKPGDHCITTEFEHNSVLRPLYRMEKQGVVVEKIGGLTDAVPLWDTLEERIQKNTKMVVVGHGSNVTGHVTDLAPIGEICRKYGILLVVDGAQTAGLLEVDLVGWGIDALCVSGHKGLLGPQGVGVLCLSPSIQVPPLIAGGTGNQSFSLEMPTDLPEALEAGTQNTHGIAGLAAGCRYLNTVGIDQQLERSTDLATVFYQGIDGLPGIRVYGDQDKRRLPIVSFNVGSLDSSYISDLLAEEFHMATRPGAHCAPGIHRHYGTEQQGMVRFSFSAFNTEFEVEEAVRAVVLLTKELL